MTIQALAQVIVTSVLHELDAHTFAGIPATDIQRACDVVAQIIREESQACVEPDAEEAP